MNSIKAMQLISKKQRTNHLLHFIVTVVTVGAWFPVWILIYVLDVLTNMNINRKIRKLERAQRA